MKKTWFLVLTAALIVSSAVGRTQSPPATPDMHAMMANQHQILAAMQATDKTLDDLVAQMNAAHGNERLDKVIAVINELATAHRQMNGMMSMHGGMMHGMMSVPPDGQKPTDDQASHHSEKK